MERERERERWLFIDSSVQFRWLLSVYMGGIIADVKIKMVRMRVRFSEEGREWRLPGLFYADDLVL